MNLVITGSNSKLLSHEMASTLTGRYIQITVLPFSFSETIRFKEQSLPATVETTPIETGKMLGLLHTFFFNQVKEALAFNSVATVQKFIGYLEEPYLFQHITRYDNKIKSYSMLIALLVLIKI